MTYKDTSFVLAQLGGWKIWADYEALSIENLAGERWKIGEMYGNPQAALITMDEKYAVVVGCGVMVADLCRFGGRITKQTSLEQTPVVHFLCEPDPPAVGLPSAQWHFEALYETGEIDVVRLVTDLYSDYGGIYEMRLPDLALKPLLVRSIKADELD